MGIDRPMTKRHPDDEYCDRIEIRTVPRFKASGLSGNGWRVSAMLEMYRKGRLVEQRRFHSIRDAASWLSWGLRIYMEEGPSEGYFDSEKEGYCFQPGCPERAVSEYELIDEFARSGDGPLPRADWKYRRKFCVRHLDRGDCAREDCNQNYTVISGPGPEDAKAAPDDVSPSAFGGVI